MRISGGVEVAENLTEFLAKLPPRPPVVKKSRKYKAAAYLDCTCTFDTETTNTETDGFVYSFQMCFAGQVVIVRYIEDFYAIIDTLLDRWRVTDTTHLVIYVHNLPYEYFYLIQSFVQHWGDCKALYTKNKKPLYLKFENGLEFRDSLKLFQKSLASATKGCPHEKAKGDLDYSIYRTLETPLTDTEYGYCVNDVLGLFEAIERMKQEAGYNQATIPFTNTGRVIQAVNEAIRRDYNCLKVMRRLQLDPEQMRIAYKAMAGGDTHGARWYAGQTLENCNSYDFKSAHPSQQLLWKFPIGKPFTLPENLDRSQAELFIQNGYGWVGLVYLFDVQLKPECPDPCISFSKCEAVNSCRGLENGRVMGADSLLVWCDSNDWQRITDGYTFADIQLVQGFGFRLDYLPASFRRVIMDKFRIKEAEKGSPDYMFAKICVNTIFGACAQKTIRDEYTATVTPEGIVTDFISWEKNLEQKSAAEVEKSQAQKLPFLWGLWTASMTRLCLWQMLKIVGWDRVVYWDTDSCKYHGPKCPAIEQYNARIRAQCVERGAVVEKKDGSKVYIGSAEDEFPGKEYGYRRFRFLHAKCYAAEAWNGTEYEIESTIAGVGKKEGVACLNGDIDNLAPGLYIPVAGGQKLAYYDIPLHDRHDFARPTQSASFIFMSPRDYSVSAKHDDLAAVDFEILA